MLHTKILQRSIFEDLTEHSLLVKCLHGNTQNNNETLNDDVWKRCPKDTYVGREVLQYVVLQMYYMH